MKNKIKRKSHLLALEPRMMFDGAGVVTAVAIEGSQTAQPTAQISLTEAFVEPIALDPQTVGLRDNSTTQNFAATLNSAISNDRVDDPIDAKVAAHFDSERADALGFGFDQSIATPVPTDGSNDFIFIDTGIENYQELLQTWQGKGTIVLINAASDGVEQVLSALAGESDIGAIHIVSHGEDGMFWLGDTRIDSIALTGELAEVFASIGSKLSVDGDILLYGCDVGADATGQALLNNLAAITGADIAASIDDTGHILRGGDWTLESRVGQIEATSLIAENWYGLLAPAAFVTGPFDVFDENGNQVADNTRLTEVGSSAVWFDVATVNGQQISVRATVTALTPGDDVQFSGPGDDFGVFLRKGSSAGLGTVEIRWDIFFTATGAPANVDVNFTVADIDGNGGPETREFLVIDTDTLSSFEAANGSNVLFDTSVPGEVTASGSQNENSGVPSAARFNWLDTNSFTIEYNLANGFGGAFFRHDGDADFNLGTGGTTVSIPRLDLDGNNSTATGSAYMGTYVENGAGVSIVDSDVTITNPNGQVQGASISLTNAQTGDSLLVNGSAAASGTLGGGISYTRTATEIILSGPATAAQYEAALQAITFETAGEFPSEADRSIDISFENAALTSNVATSTIKVVEVNDPPIAVDDPQQTTNEDTPITNIDVLNNDSDVDDASLTVTTVNATNGTVTINPDGTLNYTPNANFSGTDTITYTISDGRGGTDTAIVPIVVNAVNDAPVAVGNLPPQSNLDADAGISVDTSSGFGDVDNPSLTYSATGLPPGLSINTATGEITGTIDNSASQGGSAGVYNIVVTATDAGGLSATQAFSWTVANPGPTAMDDTASTNEDTPVTITVLGNDNDPDGDDLTVTSASAPNGSVVINPDGTITYAPNADFNGTDTITYTISDGEGGTSTATVTVTVGAANDAPVAAGTLPPQTNLDADSGISVDTSGGFTDVDNATLTYSATGLPPGLSIDSVTGEITGTIDNSASQGGAGGVYSVEVTATDAGGLSATQTFSWTVTNPAPVAVDDTASTDEDTPVLIDVLPNDSDPDGDVINVISAVASVGQATLVGNQINFVPPPNFNGTATITYTISDGEGGTSQAVVTVTVNPVNDAPDSTPIPPEDVVDGEIVSVPVAGSFSDVEGDDLTFSATDLPPGLSIDPDTGVISGTITPDASQTNGGVYTATITVSDGNGGTTTETITFNVSNPPPLAVDDSASTDEDVPVIIDVLGNDSDPDGDPLTVTSADAQNGVAIINPDGTLTYTPNPGFNGTDTITYEISDGNGGTSIATVTVTVADINDAPMTSGSIGDQTNLDDQVINLPVAGAFNDPDGDALSYSATGLPAGLTIDPVTGIISGTIDNSASQVNGGVYSVTVTADDGRGGTVSQTFEWTVTNPAPIASNDNATTDEDTPVNINVLANDVDPDGDDLTVIEANAGNGTVTINPDGTLVYTPNPDFNGTDTIVYTISDGEGGESSASVDVVVTPVNDAPTTVGLPNQNGEDGQTVSIPTADAFNDIDGDALTFTATGLPPALTIDPVTGVISGTLDSDSSQNGPFVVTVTATDPSGEEVSTTFVYSIQNIPPVAQNDTATTPEDTPVTVNVLANDSDPDGDALTITSASSNNGTVVVNPDGTVTFTPDPDFNGDATVTYTVSDGQGGVATATLVVTVTPENDAPTAAPIPDVVNEDNQSVSVATDSFFEDIDGDTLTITAMGLPPGLSIDPVTGIISGTLTIDASQGGPASDGVYEVTLTADDGNGGTVSQTFNWTVTNPAPTAVNDAASTDEETPVNVNVLGNDTDPDGDPLTVVSASAPNGTVVIEADGTLTYTPNPDFNGTDTITYEISDGNGGFSTAAVVVTVNPINDPPVAVDDAVTTDEDTPVIIGVLGNDSDVDGDPLTVTSATSPDGTVVINPDGTITFTPNPDFNGNTTITYEISDGNGGTATATVDVTVNPINDPPIANPDMGTTNEDTPVTVDLIGNDTDADGDPLTITAVNAPNGTVVINGDGTVTYTPDPDFNGTDTITYTISDGNGGFSTSTATITVTPDNDAPVAAPIAPQNNNDDAPVTLDVSGNFSDVDGDTPTFSATGLPPGLSIDANGNITGTLDNSASQGGPNGDGIYTVEVTADDGNGGTVTTSFTWTVENPAPNAVDDAASTDEDTPINIDVLGNDSDPDGDDLTVTSAVAGNGTVVIEADGTITYTPDQDFNGTDTITYTISDGEGGTSTATVTVTVDPVNDAPVATPIAAQNNVDAASVSLPTAGNFSDIDGDTLTFSATGLPPGLSIDPATGEITGTIDNSASQGGPAGDGIYSVTVTADDGNGGTVSTTFSWSVTNPAPVAADDTATTDEDTPVNIPVLSNDNDPDGDDLSVVSAVAVNGTVVIEPDGTVTYTPNADFNGTDTITYTISDGEGGTSTATVTVTVNPVNDAPVADPQLTNQTDADGDAISLDVSGNFTDIDGDTLTFSATGLPPGLSIDANGIVTGTIDNSASQGGPNGDGLYTVTVTADDGNGGTATSTFVWTIGNPPPVAADDTATTDEDVPVTIPVLANDNDPDGDALTVSAASANNGTVIINADGTVTYTPNGNFNGTDTIVYTIDDGEGGTSTATVTVTVNPVNDAPVTVGLPDLVDGNNEAISVPLAPAFNDPDGDPLTFNVTGLPAGLTFDPGTGLVSGTTSPTASTGGPNGDGIYTVTVTADDGNGGITSTTFTWTINNEPPTAVNDNFTTDEDTPIVMDVLANDIDPDGDPNTPINVIAASATNGVAVINPDGTITFTPDANFVGTATVTYTIEDANGDPATAVATITINPVNDAPIATAVPDRANEDGDPISIDASAFFSDIEGDTLTYSINNLPAGLSIDPMTGLITGTIDPDASQVNGGVYSAVITADDGNGGVTDIMFVWTVTNPGPTAVDDVASTTEDTPIPSIDVLTNDNDPDNDTLTVVSASAPNGTVSINPDGTLAYTPDPDFNGTDTITYQIDDGQGGTSTAIVTVTVGADNDAPTAQALPPRSNADAEPININVSGSFDDVDGDTLSFSASGFPAGLSIDANGNITGTIDPGASIGGPNGDGVYEVTITADDGNGGTVDTTFIWTITNPPPVAANDAATTDEDTTVNIDVLDNDSDPDGDPLSVVTASAPNGTVTILPDGTIDYTPDPDFNGTDTISYTISDGNGGTATATVTVTVNPVNDPPVAEDDSAVTPEDTPVTIPVIGNDSDVDGDPLDVTSASASNGTVTINPDGTVTYTPDPDFNGTDTITYTISDGMGGTDTATVTVTVTPVNDPPVAQDDTTTTPEDTPVTIPVLGNDSDVDGDPLTVTDATSPNGTVTINPDGSITFTPDPDFNGPTTITYTIDDGMGGTATATVTVNVGEVNDPPVAVDDAATTNEDTPVTIPPLANDSDVDGDPLEVIDASAANGTVVINPDGTLTYTPDPNFNGTDVITYTISDGMGGTDTATITVTVDPVNDGPVAEDDAVDAVEDQPVTIPVLANDSDLDGDPLTVTEATSPNGTVTINPDGTVTFTPDPDFNGPTTITYTIDDGMGGTATATVTVNVAPVNDPPVGVDDTATTDEDTPVTIPALANDTDVDGNPLTIVSANSPNGIVTINPDGTLTYTPNPDFNGTDTITYQVSDGMGGFDTVTITVTVNPVNDPPVAGDDVTSVDEDGSVTIPELVNDTDADGDPLTVTAASADNGTVIINPDGSITYTPNADFFGTDTITYTITDGNGGTSTATITVTVNQITETPIDDDEAFTVISGGERILDVLANASDPDGDPLSIFFAETDTGEVVINPDGTLSFTAPPEFDGIATINYIVSDGNGGFVASTAVVTVVQATADISFLINQDSNPGFPDLERIDRNIDQGEEFITAPLVILDAVNEFRDLRGTGTLNVDQPLLTAVNNINSLRGFGTLDVQGNPINDITRYLDDIRDIRFGVDRLFDPRFGDFIPESLTGFSVRQLTTGNELFMIESIVRDRVVYVEMRDIGPESAPRVVEFQLVTRDGSPLPDWIRMDARGLAIIERPVDAETLRLIVRATLANGETVETAVVIQGATGEIQLDTADNPQASRAQTLDALMAKANAEKDDEASELLNAFS